MSVVLPDPVLGSVRLVQEQQVLGGWQQSVMGGAGRDVVLCCRAGEQVEADSGLLAAVFPTLRELSLMVASCPCSALASRETKLYISLEGVEASVVRLVLDSVYENKDLNFRGGELGGVGSLLRMLGVRANMFSLTQEIPTQEILGQENNVIAEETNVLAQETTIKVLGADGRQSDINDFATDRVLLNRRLRHDPPPLLPAPLSEIAMDTKKVKAVLRTLWKHEGFAWGYNSSYYDFMDVSIPIESFSQQTKHVLRNEVNPTVKLSDVIEVMEDPSLKPKLSKKYINLSIREIHVMIIEALMKITKLDPENYCDLKRLGDNFST